VARLGRVPYREAWALQQQIVAAVRDRALPHTLLLVEHPPVYTLGRSAKLSNVLLPPSELERLGAELIHVDRGGDVTFHGPGQVVGYPIFALTHWRMGAADYVHRLEAALIDAVAAYGVAACQIPGRVGVWTDKGQVAAIGVRISRGVSSHGFALNVAVDLRHFSYIIPCGIPDAPVTSLEAILARPVPLAAVQSTVVASLAAAFRLEFDQVAPEELRARLVKAASDYV
jgi:lipoate-protein ligase B